MQEDRDAVLLCIGFAVALTNWWILALTPVCVWPLQRFAILPEEAYLERKFGETYLVYERWVRRGLRRPAALRSSGASYIVGLFLPLLQSALYFLRIVVHGDPLDGPAA
jgi:hypothetical protein